MSVLIKTVKNRWNNKWYKVLEETEKTVTLEREDGSKFIIAKSEYFLSYYEKSC